MGIHETTIKIEPMQVACMCVVRKEPIPPWVINELKGDDLLDAMKYNRELRFLHWHVQREDRDLAFMSEHDATDFCDKLYYWEGQRDYLDSLEPKSCYDAGCDVYTPEDGLRTVENIVRDRKGS